MPEIVEIPLELTRFQLSPAVQSRLQFLLDGFWVATMSKVPLRMLKSLYQLNLPEKTRLKPLRYGTKFLYQWNLSWIGTFFKIQNVRNVNIWNYWYNWVFGL